LISSHLLLYLFLIVLIVTIYGVSRQRVEARNLTIRQEEGLAGLTEPPSLHPIIDPAQCIGCNACVEACPEENVLGVIDGKAQLIAPTKCIGHGACKAACPVDAITLVFGTEKRGVDIPFVRPNFETNVPGIFIAGELGGMGLIRNAIEQGRQAMKAVAERTKQKNKDAGVYDVVIVGAGPAGISASLAALESKLKFVTLEQETLGGTVAHYPRGKIVMTEPSQLPIIGKVKLRETSKEALLKFWEDVVRRAGLKIQYSERVEKVVPGGSAITVITPRNTYTTRAVLLAIGRRGTPRKLDVPGEDRPKVVYCLIDPRQYASHHVLVVGGGDSALEAAMALADMPDTNVTLSYRGESLTRVKPKNREKIQGLQAQGRVNLMLKSNVVEIKDDEVIIRQDEKTSTLKNDAVIVCAGGILPTGFLKEIGIGAETKYGTA
jgi:thioredoxin reductase/ferredoxin